MSHFAFFLFIFRVADPHPFNADPDPAFSFNANPDPGRAPHQSDESATTGL
jgi:hypothetical protein